MKDLTLDDSWRPPYVELETSLGKILIELYWNHAPKTCKNFAELSRRKYYNNTKFHRIVPDYIIQGGDPTGTGKGGKSIYGNYFDDEIHPDLKHTGAGIISMANAGPNINGSQFYITLGPLQSLDNKSTIFGRVCRGINVVKQMSKLPTDKNNCPIENVYIKNATVINE